MALTTRIVTGSEKYTTCSFPLANDMAGSWCAENSLMADNEFLHAICRSHLCDGLGYLLVPVPAIAANNECAAINTFWDCQENTGNERLAVMVFLKDFDFLSETRPVRVLT